MRCPYCGCSNDRVQMKSPDYGRGAEFVCYACRPGPEGRRFNSNTRGVDRGEAARASEAAKAESKANAEAYRKGNER